MRILIPLCVLAAFLAGCAGRSRSTIREPIPEWVSRIETQPLDVKDVRTTTSGGVHVLLLQMTRFPESIRHDAEETPPKIHVYLGGPVGGEDVPARTVVPASDVVNAVHISRSGGVLHVTLDLGGDRPPQYSVHEMADWLMIRMIPRS